MLSQEELVRLIGDAPTDVARLLLVVLILRLATTAVQQIAATLVALLSNDRRRADRALIVLQVLHDPAQARRAIRRGRGGDDVHT